ncbi:N-acetylgalactosamine 4-sulfatase/arylsulftase B [Haloferula helveola]|uniref:N-acetylgalactosamine 4-sulfatase/arylsulftase B n=1 Tax=Haloferula helveola TaxID=490095 RepID=A0ABN6GZN4_9BACT|nr:N-acetylgalactosamine 4-sulfatase/arylsulftase B [Haloferula helveola]
MHPHRPHQVLPFLTFLLVISFRLLAAEEKPNIIVIITDDQGWADIGYNNPGRAYTPHLDRLAANGVTLTRHYVMPQCTPTRVAAMTGRYPGRFGTVPLEASNEPAFPHGTPTLASMLKEAGYTTHLSGKWHLGSSPDHGPNHFGFDSSYGSLAGAVGMYDHRYSTKSPYSVTWHRDHAIIPGYENGTHATDLVAADATHFIRREHERPFFLYLAFHAPHTPLDERGPFVDTPTQLDPDNPKRWLNENKIKWFNDPKGVIQREPDPEKRLLLAAVHHVDHAVGEVVTALRETGHFDNTLILFSSDNGPQGSWGGNAYPSDLKLTDFNQPIPMKGRKLDVWEGGIHVPGFMHWPARLKPRREETPVHIVDWFPTLATITGGVPPERPDGRDLSSLLLDRERLPERDFYWTWHPTINRRALSDGEWKIVRYGHGEPKQPSDWKLFRLSDDPKEQNDLAKKHPDELKRLHDRYLSQRALDGGR